MRRVHVPLLPRWVRWLPVLVVAATIAYFSLVAAPRVPGVRSPWLDDAFHFLAYAGFALVLAYATANWRDRPYLRAALVVGMAIGYGALVELLQLGLPRRTFSRTDLLANTLGACLVAVWFVVERRVRYVRRPQS